MDSSVIISSEIQGVLEKIVPCCNDEVIIISAFCKLSTLQFIDGLLGNKTIKKRLLTRFLPSDIASKATDKEIYQYCKYNSWDIFIDYSIHAKVYIFDKKECIIGSANLTNKGLGIAGALANKEASALFNLDDETFAKVETLFSDAVTLDDNLYDKIVKSISDDEIIYYVNRQVVSHKNVECLFPEDFPNNSTNKEELLSLNSFIWLVNYLRSKEEHSAFYGELSSAIHNVFVKDPRPYRKNIKEYLSSLLDSIQRLNIEEIEITRPHHSQLVTYKGHDASQKIMLKDNYIFISYCHKNKNLVNCVVDELQKKYNVWLDENINWSVEWSMNICEMIQNCALFVFFTSEDSLESEFCKDEINHAKNNGKTYLTLLIEEIELPSWYVFSFGRFQMSNYLNCSNPKEFVALFERTMDSAIISKIKK